MKIIFVIIVWTICCKVNFAQSPWSLEKCMSYALENNIDIKQLDIDIKQRAIDLSSSKSKRLPVWSAGVSQSLNLGRSQSQATGIYEERQTSSTSMSTSFSVPLFSGFSITNAIHASKLNFQASVEELKQLKYDIKIQIIQLYLDVLLKKEILNIYKNNVEMTQKQIERTRILVKLGKIQEIQLSDIEAQLLKDELDVKNAFNLLSMALLNLAQSLNIDYKGFDILPIETIENINNDTQYPLSVFEHILKYYPEIQKAQYELAGSQVGIKVAQAFRWPSFNLNASYSTGFSNIIKQPGGKSGSEEAICRQLNGNQRQVVGLNLSIPIYNRNQTNNQIKIARLNMEKKLLEVEKVKQALYKDIQQLYQNITVAKSKYLSAVRAVQALEKTLLYTRERYNTGKVTVYELSEAEKKVIIVKSELLQAKYEFAFYVKILNFYQDMSDVQFDAIMF